MRHSSRNARIAAVTLALLLGSACGGGQDREHAAHGVVRSVDAAARQISIAHGDIPGFMKAMTMTFALAPDVSLEGIERGMEVDFGVKLDSGTYTVTRLEPVGRQGDS